MASGVVQQLEVVQVDEQQRPVLGTAGAGQQGAVDAVTQQAAVGQGRQGVIEGQPIDALLGGLAPRHIAQERHQQSMVDCRDRDLKVDPVPVAVPVAGLEALMARLQDALDLRTDAILCGRLLEVRNLHAHDFRPRAPHHAAIRLVHLHEAALGIQHPVAVIGAVQGLHRSAGTQTQPTLPGDDHRADQGGGEQRRSPRLHQPQLVQRHVLQQRERCQGPAEHSH